jgi:hypothetical protein
MNWRLYKGDTLKLNKIPVSHYFVDLGYFGLFLWANDSLSGLCEWYIEVPGSSFVSNISIDFRKSLPGLVSL